MHFEGKNTTNYFFNACRFANLLTINTIYFITLFTIGINATNKPPR